MNRIFVASTLANDPHTEGLHNAGKIARMAGVETVLLEPSDNLDALCEAIKEHSPRYIGLSYRLSPTVACRELEKALSYFVSTGLLKESDDVKISFAGLPETISMVKERMANYPLRIELCQPYPDVLDRIKETLAFFEAADKDRLLEKLKEEVKPAGISILDQIADEAVAGDRYKLMPPLRIPSVAATSDYVKRISESDIPLLRSHFGIPANDIRPTVEGIKELAEARVVDEISLGSSDLSQRYFGHPEMFAEKKNDGGVPYKDMADLKALFLASRMGNYPSVKPYCHVNDIVHFIDQCIETGMLTGAHQAIPLYWFNELDGRGSKTVRESVHEHFAAVKHLARLGIPVEMNDPNQWSSRLAHDTLIVASYSLISAVMTMCGVRDMVLQMQFNKPKETGDYADLAKMSAGLDMARAISQHSAARPSIIIETRAGIEHFSPDMEHAKWQLARTTLLQMIMDPKVIHIVSYCEANYAARPADIIDSSRLIRRSIELFRANKEDILASIDTNIVEQRKAFLKEEAGCLLQAIAQLHPKYRSVPIEGIAPYLGDPDVIAESIERKMMASPGIINPKYKADYLTKPMKYGMINAVTDFVNPKILTEKERLKTITT